MTSRRPNPSQLIYQVVQGERPCADLFQLRVKIEVIDDKWQIESPPLESVKLHISHVARGLLRYRSSPADAKKWARLLLASA